jgi:hypothetical protein
VSAVSSAFVEPRGTRPRQSALLWLAFRLVLHLRGGTVARLLWLAAGLAVAGGPLIVWLAAGLSDSGSNALPASTGLSLALVACPGIALALWAAHSLAPDRAALAEALRQVGAERAAAWLLPALRVAVAAGLGALAGAIGQGTLRATVFRALPDKAPLRATLAAITDGTWIVADAGVILLLIAVTLFTSGAGHRIAVRLSSRFNSRLGQTARVSAPEVSAT